MLACYVSYHFFCCFELLYNLMVPSNSDNKPNHVLWVQYKFFKFTFWYPVHLKEPFLSFVFCKSWFLVLKQKSRTEHLWLKRSASNICLCFSIPSVRGEYWLMWFQTERGVKKCDCCLYFPYLPKDHWRMLLPTNSQIPSAERRTVCRRVETIKKVNRVKAGAHVTRGEGWKTQADSTQKVLHSNPANNTQRLIRGHWSQLPYQVHLMVWDETQTQHADRDAEKRKGRDVKWVKEYMEL